MISLFLTLFISLFSIGSSINTIDVPKENEIVLNENIQEKSIYQFNNNYYLGSGSELFDSTFMTRLIRLSAVNTGTQTPTEFKIENLLLKFNTADYVNLDNGTISMPGDIFVDTIILTTSYTGTNNKGFDFHRYTVSFKYGDTNYFSYLVEWYYPTNATYPYDVSLSNYVFSNYGNSGLRNFLFIFDRTTANNETMYNLLVDIDAYANYDYGYSQGYDAGDSAGYNRGYQTGYAEGLNNTDYDSTALTIFSGIMGIALVPINMFLQIFNFEILGINLSGFISGILTVAVVVIIIRMVTGGKKDD